MGVIVYGAQLMPQPTWQPEGLKIATFQVLALELGGRLSF